MPVAFGTNPNGTTPSTPFCQAVAVTFDVLNIAGSRSGPAQKAWISAANRGIQTASSAGKHCRLISVRPQLDDSTLRFGAGWLPQHDAVLSHHKQTGHNNTGGNPRQHRYDVCESFAY
jgi:hypothetical protein